MPNKRAWQNTGRVMVVRTKPTYCDQCGRQNTWERQESRDLKSTDGEVLFERWVCPCGNETLYPGEGLRREGGKK
jgi:hypothetical protein